MSKKVKIKEIFPKDTLSEYLLELIEHYQECRISWLLDDPQDHPDPKGHIRYYEAHIKHIKKIIKEFKNGE